MCIIRDKAAVSVEEVRSVAPLTRNRLDGFGRGYGAIEVRCSAGGIGRCVDVFAAADERANDDQMQPSWMIGIWGKSKSVPTRRDKDDRRKLKAGSPGSMTSTKGQRRRTVCS